MIRILVVDSHRLFRMGLRKMLPEANGFSIVAEAESGEQAVDLARELMPHVVLMDILMPGIGGLEATVRIRRMNPDVRVIALTACETNPFPVQMLRAGATGCFLITKAVHELHRSQGEYALISMCCGGGLGTGTLLQRL